MRYYGIKTPEGEHPEVNESHKSHIWWITDSEHNSWMAFFTNLSRDNTYNPHRYPLYEAIKAYEAIGYKCVELEVKEKT